MLSCITEHPWDNSTKSSPAHCTHPTCAICCLPFRFCRAASRCPQPCHHFGLPTNPSRNPPGKSSKRGQTQRGEAGLLQRKPLFSPNFDFFEIYTHSFHYTLIETSLPNTGL